MTRSVKEPETRPAPAETLEALQRQYGEVARSSLSNESTGVRRVAEAFGYSADELQSLPPEANLGLSCGNPVAIASLREGEVVVDLGCGGGLDALLAANRVGSTGKVVGIDMTPDMIERATANAKRAGATNVEFHLATIDRLPLADQSVDCILSNCVINLLPDKRAAFREMLRVLKPGGRLAASDIALKQPLPASVHADLAAYIGCVAGAMLLGDYADMLREAGFQEVAIRETHADLTVYSQAGATDCCSSAPANACCDGTPQGTIVHDGLAEVFRRFDVNAYADSVQVFAIKPRDGQAGQAIRQDEVTLPLVVAPLPVLPLAGCCASGTACDAPPTLQVYDRALCCATGICGPEVDPVLPRFAADLDWLEANGVRVERYNLAQQPQAFVARADVQQMLARDGVECLPLVFAEGRLMSERDYPTRPQMAAWFALCESATESSPATGSSAIGGLPVLGQGGCCGDSGCC